MPLFVLEKAASYCPYQRNDVGVRVDLHCIVEQVYMIALPTTDSCMIHCYALEQTRLRPHPQRHQAVDEVLCTCFLSSRLMICVTISPL